MKRTVFHELKKWKEDSRRKPLLIRGVRHSSQEGRLGAGPGYFPPNLLFYFSG